MACDTMIARGAVAVVALGVMILSARAVAHCNVPNCEERYHTHPGEDIPLEVTRYDSARQKVQDKVVIQRIFEVPKIQAPLDLPKLDVPPGVGLPKAPVPQAKGGDKPIPIPPTDRPLTPVEFARQGLPVQNAAQLNMVVKGVMDSTRAILNANGIEGVAKEAPEASSGRMIKNNMIVVNEALEQLRAYNKIMQAARTRANEGNLDPYTTNLVTDSEFVYRFSQEIIQIPGERR